MHGTLTSYQGLIRRYSEYLPVQSSSIVTLHEGNTPLVSANHFAKFLNLKCEIYLKYEGLNPTGSFKDRGMTVAVSKAVEGKSPAIICASTGNTSASAAAYAAKAGVKCLVLIPKGNIALGKLAQALIHGAKVLAVEGSFDDALTLVKEVTSKYNFTLVNSLNPYRIEGQKTAAYEVCDQLGRAPDYQVIPIGNAGNITAYWKGYQEYKKAKKISSLPKMIGFQAEGAAPIVRKRIIPHPETMATAIRIGNPASWEKAEEARDESGGLIDLVSDNEILSAYKLIAGKAGLFVEPASAASIAGLLKLSRKNYFKKESKIVCILTGHGLKDPDRAIKSIKEPKTVAAKLEAVMKEIKR